MAKLYPDWLDALPAKMWLIQLAGKTGYPVDDYILAYMISYGGLAFDFLFVPLISWHRTRLIALFFCALFHVTNSQIFSIGIFPWLMLGITPIFLPSSWIRTALFMRRLKIKKAVDKVPFALPGRGMIYLLSVYFILQLILPLRHFLYPGISVWTEEGARFSWQMMLRSKIGQIAFIVNDASNPEKKVPYPYPWHLKKFQIHRMETTPDLIIQYAHYIRDDMKRRGMKDPEVRVKTDVILNARKPRALIDPDVDLAKEEISLFRPYKWILPEPKEWP